MDLVEIRKKANKKKKPAKKVEDSEEILDHQQQGPVEAPPAEPETATALDEQQPEEVVEVADAALDESVEEVATAEEAPVVPAETDPIDALFSFRLDDSLAASENYLQALVAEDDVVDSNIEQWLTFSLGNEEYALSIESVSEIIKPREVTDIPRVPDFISGIISLRGIIVPVFDLNRRLNLGRAEMGSTARIIVCQNEDRLAGFIVDSINQVVNVPLGKIEPPPTVLSGLDRDFVEGVGRVGDRMLILLHLSNVINAELV